MTCSKPKPCSTAAAEGMEVLHATEKPDGVTDWSGQIHDEWTRTLAAAKAYLNEETDR